MRRRDFVTVVGSLAAWPLVARSQPAMPVIGFLSGASPETMRELVAAFHRGLADTGFAEGRNLMIEYRWAEGNNDRLPALAMDLVRRKVAVIATVGSTPAALASKAATQTIPIVFFIGTDPVKVGLVASLARPGGNVTGITAIVVELLSKGLDLMAARHSVPTIYAAREFVLAGGLMSYGTDQVDAVRQVGVNVGRILKGEKVGDLPVQQVTKIQLAINLKTAKALGLNIPNTLIGRADEVIE